MPGYLLTASAAVTCAHGGQVMATPAPVQSIVTSGGAPLLTGLDQLTVVGCAGVNGVLCTVVTWLNTATRVTVGGQPVLTQATPVGPGGGTIVGPPPEIPLVKTVQQLVVAT
jgi:hypothetical protein